MTTRVCLPNERSSFAELRALAEGFAAAQGVSETMGYRIVLILDELFANVHKYSLGDPPAASVEVGLERDGDTLVVDTAGFRDGGWLDIIGSPLTDAGKVTERFRRVSYGRMEIDVTIEDRKAYTQPFTVRVNQQLMLDEELIEFICLENQRFGR